jgi:predicted CXXCH cytochrome family protein
MFGASLAVLLIALVTLIALCRLPQGAAIRSALATCGLLATAMLLTQLFVNTGPPDPVAAALPPVVRDSSFAGSASCRACHPEQYASWHRTFHRTMTQQATPETVLAPFQGRRLEVDGQVSRVYREGDEFWVDTIDPEWELAQFDRGEDIRDMPSAPRVQARIVMTTGSHHFQAYWLRSAYGRELWLFPWRYHLRQQRWVHRRDVFLGPPEWRPGMHFRVWNDNCIFCHATGGQPGLNPQTNYLEQTRVAELGIACEACHGAGGSHVRANQNPLRRYLHYGRSGDPTIVNPARLSAARSLDVCAVCHANFLRQSDRALRTGFPFRPGESLSRYGRYFRPADEEREAISSRFWADGSNRSTGREAMGVKESACHVQGQMSCLSCHSMHHSDPDDQLAQGMSGNEACYQCHAAYREQLTEHTHHAADSSGSQCYNCHMPHTNYGLYKATRSHHIDIPRVATITHKARPNACNLCHLDKTLGWTASYLDDWYGKPPVRLQADEEAASAAAIWLLRGDAAQRVVVAWHCGWHVAQETSGHGWLAPLLAPLLNDPYAAVRWVAEASLRTLPPFADLSYDFGADPAARAVVAEQIWQRWSSDPLADRAAVGRALGGPPAEWPRLLGEILKCRDDRPISSVE